MSHLSKKEMAVIMVMGDGCTADTPSQDLRVERDPLMQSCTGTVIPRFHVCQNAASSDHRPRYPVPFLAGDISSPVHALTSCLSDSRTIPFHTKPGLSRSPSQTYLARPSPRLTRVT
eukprot:scpid106958/ scgid14581/ 